MIDLERRGQVALATIRRPEALNAINRAMEDALRETFRDIAADDTLRAVVLTGTGRAFSVGVDLRELASGEGMTRIWHGPDSAAAVIRDCGKPIIAAVNGYAITGGLELALTADFLIASDKAQFADTHARVGITPAWGLTQVLPRLIGVNRARQMSLTGAFVGAAQALDWGLVNEVTTPAALVPRALEIAAEIAETDRAAMDRIRRLIGDSQNLSLAEGLAREVAAFDTHMAGVTPGAVGESRKAVQARGRRIAGGGA